MLEAIEWHVGYTDRVGAGDSGPNYPTRAEAVAEAEASRMSPEMRWATQVVLFCSDGTSEVLWGPNQFFEAPST